MESKSMEGFLLSLGVISKEQKGIWLGYKSFYDKWKKTHMIWARPHELSLVIRIAKELGLLNTLVGLHWRESWILDL